MVLGLKLHKTSKSEELISRAEDVAHQVRSLSSRIDRLTGEMQKLSSEIDELLAFGKKVQNRSPNPPEEHQPAGSGTKMKVGHFQVEEVDHD